MWLLFLIFGIAAVSAATLAVTWKCGDMVFLLAEIAGVFAVLMIYLRYAG